MTHVWYGKHSADPDVQQKPGFKSAQVCCLFTSLSLKCLTSKVRGLFYIRLANSSAQESQAGKGSERGEPEVRNGECGNFDKIKKSMPSLKGTLTTELQQIVPQQK